MSEVSKYFADAFRHLGGKRGVLNDALFYPYAGLRRTIRSIWQGVHADL